MKRIIFIFLLSLMILSVKSQKLDKQNIDNWLITTFPKIQLDNQTLYIIDGFALNYNDDFSKIASSYEMTDIGTINYIDSTTLSKTSLCYKWNNIVVITIGEQDKNTIKQSINKCRKLFKKREIITTADININDNEPVLIIDGKQIYFKECYHTINSLEVENIKSINYIDKAVSVEMYGANAINGLIIIKTKKDQE